MIDLSLVERAIKRVLNGAKEEGKCQGRSFDEGGAEINQSRMLVLWKTVPHFLELSADSQQIIESESVGSLFVLIVVCRYRINYFKRIS